jgi:hypothetical protein
MCIRVHRITIIKNDRSADEQWHGDNSHHPTGSSEPKKSLAGFHVIMKMNIFQMFE